MCTKVDTWQILKKDKKVYKIVQIKYYPEQYISSVCNYYHWHKGINKAKKGIKRKRNLLEKWRKEGIVQEGFFHFITNKKLAMKSIRHDDCMRYDEFLILEVILKKGTKIGIGHNWLCSEILNGKKAIVAKSCKVMGILPEFHKITAKKCNKLL